MVAPRKVQPDRLRGAILQEDARVVAEHSIADGGLDTNTGSAAGHHEVLRAQRLENRVEFRLVEAAESMLGDNDIRRFRGELVHDARVPGAPNQDPPLAVRGRDWLAYRHPEVPEPVR